VAAAPNPDVGSADKKRMAPSLRQRLQQPPKLSSLLRRRLFRVLPLSLAQNKSG